MRVSMSSWRIAFSDLFLTQIWPLYLLDSVPGRTSQNRNQSVCSKGLSLFFMDGTYVS